MKPYYFTPDILDAMPEELAELYRTLELKLLKEIADRLKAAGQLNEVTVQSIRALRSHGISTKEIKKAIAETAQISENELDKLLDDVVERNQAYYTDMIDLAKVTEPEELVNPSDIAAIEKQTRGELNNISRSMGFLVDSGRTMLPPARAYQWALDSAIMQIQSGAISYNQAIANATRQLADSGLMVAYDKDGNIRKNYVQYESGHVNRVDVAVRRAVMSGVNALNQQYANQSIEYLGAEYVEVSAHAGARNTGVGFQNHESWQGKIYRINKTILTGVQQDGIIVTR